MTFKQQIELEIQWFEQLYPKLINLGYSYKQSVELLTPLLGKLHDYFIPDDFLTVKKKLSFDDQFNLILNKIQITINYGGDEVLILAEFDPPPSQSQ